MSFKTLLTNLPEIIAVILAIVYLLLAVKQNIWCWLAWILSSCLYCYIMYSVGLYMESGLQVFYIVMGIYGWSQWKQSKSDTVFEVFTWTPIQHCFSILLILFLTVASGYLLDQFTQALLPFWDALTTWGAIMATYMVAKKVLENWLYWFAIDLISVFLFASRELYLTAFLFFFYLFIIVIGYRSWNQARLRDV
ncbi:MAG: nicotinamide mononucleotide transporter [Gammaproteobacteria bacterium]|jgi:nicotinamide mononucleotide transporter|nr:nicotinamide mononucleotide transporter [Gammaproteobacteria bacterium]MBT5542021.1 nicotinamide mononucleotide transporter [Gammaproteobacteria bacterium]